MLRKTVFAFIAGILVAIGTSVAYAEVASMIGKQVDGQIPLVINGKPTENPAVTIEGISYIRLRAAGTLFGYNVSWIDGEVVMDQIQKPTEQQSTVEVPTAEELAEVARIEQEMLDQQTRELNEKNNAVDKLRKDVLLLQIQIDSKQIVVDQKKEEVDSIEQKIVENPEYTTIDGPIPYTESSVYKRDLIKLDQLKAELAAAEANLADLEAQMAALEAQLPATE